MSAENGGAAEQMFQLRCRWNRVERLCVKFDNCISHFAGAASCRIQLAKTAHHDGTKNR